MTEQPEQPQQPADSAEPPAEEQQAVGWLPRPAGDLFGAGATAELAYDLLTVDVPADAWIGALTVARDELGCTYFDWLSAVDEPGTGFRICVHLADVARPGAVRRLVVRTTVPHDTPVLPTAVGVFAGAGWHERETHEMFGVDFTGHPHLVPLLLPDTFEGHPLRKDFVLAARVAKAWPGAKEPGEPAAGAAHGGPKRRQMLPPGVPDPNEWGPLKGQLPPAPARPARGARAAAGAAGERPARRTRSVSAGSASQQTAATEAPTTEAPTTEAAAGAPAERPARAARPDRPPRRNRSVSQGSASQQAAAAEAAAPEPTAPPAAASEDAAAEGTPAARRPAAPPRSADAPWHHARPAFEEAEAAGKPAPAPEPGPADAPPAQRPEDEGGDTP
ncbi:NADH-quinone oxidoreductase subunit C [Streptomyces yunnanensis]|uniref:NADH dehydrogenase subunit C n=1 Tax=Streptomyces yunnanensis TaxID=156453 RepID=A0A9X8QNQ6_9ACTN|nr:NADH-quinone oxidoreductase subunit C [Streptomyces yunnanensis]SHK98031.1 NADH dehydrogenase subunit C [Streptomyces yunnanensis]